MGYPVNVQYIRYADVERFHLSIEEFQHIAGDVLDRAGRPCSAGRVGQAASARQSAGGSSMTRPPAASSSVARS